MERGGGWASIDNRIVLRIEKSQSMKGMRPWSRQETGWREKRRGERAGERMESEYVAMRRMMRWNYDGGGVK